MALYGFQLFVLLLRGPHCKRYTWFGYEGGLEPRKYVVDERKRLEAEKTLEFSLPSDSENVINREDKALTGENLKGFETFGKRGNEEIGHLE